MMAERRTITTITKFLIALGVAATLALAGLGSAQAAPEGGHGDGHGEYNPSHEFNWTDFGYKGKQTSHGPMSPPFVLMLINFAIVIGLGIVLAGPGIGRYLQKRHTTIKDALAEAAELRAQAQAKLDEYADKLAAAERETDELIEGIRADAEAEKKRIMAEAERQAAAMKAEASERIAAEIERARGELEREVVAAAIAAAEAILREQTTTDDQNQLFRAFVSDITKRRGPAEKEQA